MGWEAWFCLAVVGAVFTGLTLNIAADALLVGAVVILTLAGIISPEQAFAGFSNTAMLTVAALYIVAAGLRETGALSRLGTLFLGGARNEFGVLVRLAGVVTPLSGFLNNTPIVSMFIPIISEWGKKHQVSPSRLLLPLSYFSILGGTCTLIGTSTNLVVNGLMHNAAAADPALAETLYPMSLFELGRVGLPYALVGIAYMLLVGRRLLPNRGDFLEIMSSSSRDYLVDMRVAPDCPLIGQGVEQAGLRHLPGLFLIQIRRGDEIIAPVAPDQALHLGDVLTFTGIVSSIVDLERLRGIEPVADEAYENRSEMQRGNMLCEAVVSGTSPVVAKTVRDADFRARYNAAIVAVHRGGERLEGRVGDVVLRPGDTLLLQTGPHFVRAHRNNPDFLLVSGVEDSHPFRYDKAVIASVLLTMLLVAMAAGLLKIVMAAFLVAGLMVLTRCLSIAQARQSVDWQTLITIGAAFGLAEALAQSGLVGSFAAVIGDVASAWGPYALVFAVYLMTSIFTETITNNAAAALVFPFAVALAAEAGVSPRPLVMAVAYAASASFSTPLGYQTNLMVFGPGGYRLKDFIRIGLPLNILLLITAMFFIPLAWSF